ncbi:MAG: ATP synthase F1 subunit gamma [Candidatus Omnitrophica bacterium]|nr:ATP synthase F1 subunit gamma [Candidatus Omnitrophota bacterium]MDD5310225.1 ATP synthase F1 subunit gamma [Candidatus Omnitrophota bacterium]MDD5546197.1 ATP synthase F1 subunit gamma [Candidatus Omnitrophota bacterium]
MILSLRQIKRRIKSVESTKKITRAMQMVSTAKFKRSEDMLYIGRPYYLKLDSILQKLIASLKPEELGTHPLLEDRAEKKNLAICLITSDSGLCSVYNNNIIRVTEDFIEQHGKEKIKLVAIGRKGFAYFAKRDVKIAKSYIGLHGRYSPETADEIADALTGMFLSGEADEVYIAHTHFGSAMRYHTRVRKLLNIVPAPPGAGTAEPKERAAREGEIEFIAEPSMEKILKDLIPRYVSVKTRLILLDAFTSEHSARMMAMQTATDNAVELIDSLTMLRNKARQASITGEVLQVATTAEALKG